MQPKVRIGFHCHHHVKVSSQNLRFTIIKLTPLYIVQSLVIDYFKRMKQS